MLYQDYWLNKISLSGNSKKKEENEMITLYIWARDAMEAQEDVKHGFGCKDLEKVRSNDFLHHENEKLFKVTINAEEIK